MDPFLNIFVTEDQHLTNCRILTISFFGTPIRTIVTSNPSIARNWIYNICNLHQVHDNQLLVGLGVQWQCRHPTIIHGHGFVAVAVADTLQLCVGQHCLIFQLNHAESVPNVLRRFLADTRITFVGILNHWDPYFLLNTRHSLRVSLQILNLGYYVALNRGEMQMIWASLEVLASEFLGYYPWVWSIPLIEWSQWDAYWLSLDQIIYASVDAYVSFEIGNRLRIWEPRIKYGIWGPLVFLILWSFFRRNCEEAEL